MDGIPKLSDGAITNKTDSFLPYMHGSEKRDCEIVAPIEVIQKALKEASLIIDTSVMETAYKMTVDSCLNEILCTLPDILNHIDQSNH